MTGWLIGSGCVLAIVGGPLAARWAGWRWHGWRLRRVHAQHAGPAVVEQVPEQDFYGSMSRDDERAWEAHHEWEAREEQREGDWLDRYRIPWLPAEPDWREQTMAELGELADPGPGVVAPSHGPPPGPVQTINEDWTMPAAADIACRSCVELDEGWTCQADLGGRCPSDPDAYYSEPTRLARTGDIYGARLDLGPRAAAVLERYEQRRQERWALA